MGQNENKVQPSDNSNLIQSIVITSDPQYPWTPCMDGTGSNCSEENDETKRTTSERLIREQYTNINSYTDMIPNTSILINGDITAYGHNQLLISPEQQWKKMNELFKIFKKPYYYGLGNHDIENNKDKCHLDKCFRDSIGELVNHVRRVNHIPDSQFDCNTYTVGAGINSGPGHSGSFAYTVHFGRICSIQLNNAPTMHSVSTGSNWRIEMKENLNWLESQLKMAKADNQIIIVHVHKPNDWVGGPSEKFKKLLKDYGVAAVFCGHYHKNCGEYTTSYANYFGGIPVFLSGSASQSKYLILEQFSDRLDIYAIADNDWKNKKSKLSSINVPEPPRFNGNHQIVTTLNNSSVLDLNGPDNVTLWRNNGGNNQKWMFVYDLTKQAYRIYSVSNSRLALAWNDFQGSRNVFATPFVQEYDEHYWIVEPFSNGYLFKNKKDPNLVLDVHEGKTGDGTNIKVHERHPVGSPYSGAQVFRL
ncbi:metallophosphoesterase [Peribacillus muralis]|uniref:metallophosphoesterase n=1 Tax=Peribacillus muralis TaxID=264697 RepID=UPI003CFC23BF